MDNPVTVEFLQMLGEAGQSLADLWLKGQSLPERVQARAQLFQELAGLSFEAVSMRYGLEVKEKEDG